MPFTVSGGHLPSPSLSPPPSIFRLQNKPQYMCNCIGCLQPLIWHCWTLIRDEDYGRWYTTVSLSFLFFLFFITNTTQCDMGEPGCEWFRWAYEELVRPSSPSEPTRPSTSMGHLISHPTKRQRSPSVEISSSPSTGLCLDRPPLWDVQSAK